MIKNLLSFSLASSLVVAPASTMLTNSYKTAYAVKNLEDIINVSNFGVLENTSASVVKEYLEKNFNIDTSQIEFSLLNYSGARIVAKKDSIDYTGSKFVSFSSKIDIGDKTTFQTELAAVDVYASEKNDSKTTQVKISAALGKNAFKEYFKKVSFAWYGYSYNNGRFGAGGDRWHNEDNLDGYLKNPGVYTEKTYSITPEKIEPVALYSRHYSNTNWMNGNGTFSFNWSTKDNVDELTLEYKVNVSAYATGANAYWARSYSQLAIRDIKLG